MGKCFSICMGLQQSRPNQLPGESVEKNTKSSDKPVTNFTDIQPQSETLLQRETQPPTQKETDTQGSRKSLNNDSVSTESQILASDNTLSEQKQKAQLIRKLSNGPDHTKRWSFTSMDSKINNLFDTYRDPFDQECILAEGIEKFCQDLKVDPDDFKILVLAWKFKAQTMCVFKREEFTSGCKAMKVDSIRSIQSKLPEIVKEVRDPTAFRNFYRWTFTFGLEQGQKALPREIASSLWTLVFSQNKPALLDRWLNFIDSHPSIKGISRDTWEMFLNLIKVIGDDLSLYDDAEAWPSLFDDFVEYEHDRQNQNVADNHD